ncbi:uncharacterized protein DS421_16g556680 [Arachis hypogaea]|nr:uncharacterized protein DS421_16g556680 [Arachis hypogaea]
MKHVLCFQFKKVVSRLRLAEIDYYSRRWKQRNEQPKKRRKKVQKDKKKTKKVYKEKVCTYKVAKVVNGEWRVKSSDMAIRERGRGM